VYTVPRAVGQPERARRDAASAGSSISDAKLGHSVERAPVSESSTQHVGLTPSVRSPVLLGKLNVARVCNRSPAQQDPDRLGVAVLDGLPLAG
jgi:hypothetical protein